MRRKRISLGSEWQRKMVAATDPRTGEPFVAESKMTRQRYRAAVRKECFKKISAEYSAEPRSVRRLVARRLAKNTQRHLQAAA